MKAVFHFLTFICLLVSSVAATANTSIIAGNESITQMSGPSSGGRATFRYSAGTNNLVFYKPTQLGPAGVTLHFSQLDSAGADGDGVLYCNTSSSASGEPMTLENKMVDSGKSYGGHKLFETTVPGLYYTLKISRIWSAWETTASISESYIGDTPSIVFRFNITNANLRRACNGQATTEGTYWAIGGIYQNLDIEFYTDQTFNPTSNQRVGLKTTSNYLYSFKSYGAGRNISSDYIYIDFNLVNLYITLPTCFTSVLTGPTVSGSTVDLGEYTAGQVSSNSASPVPFDISLQNCIRIRNIETKMTSTKVGVSNQQLLGNTLTSSDKATGVGVLIEGLPNSVHSQKVILEPNNSSSVYNDYESETDTSGGIYPEKDRGTSQPLHFQATLKQDGSAPITPGEFKATSTFQITYP
ncbi:fimbrial-like adhesin [Escherichia sp. E4742]|uniref:fimbrial-like adhesin n=1 Tax=Escherichia sp. E4742 TaxID=2044467 RepID=UPI001080B369|nr:fimbrial-like adhesin [Escherichia sp. E4742]QCT90346.1 fimbrial-like adhesin [Escherichia sp. E4742]TGB54819.1 fimbrial protein [Escherichia sp. E4742]TLJ07655.1 fimbrial-like adhesin [Escherichia sp. E4742]